jgi:hypothetical protein
MALENNKACSKVGPIAHIEALASILSTTPSELVNLSDSIPSLWKPGKVLEKKDGTPRPTHDAGKPLKVIHERIKNRLLKQVDYPCYVLGGISDKKTTRDYARHAALHAKKKILISEDIQDFFPSTTSNVVLHIWQRFFNFHPDVADLLTKLTTHEGALPQGWKTSGYLAKLPLKDNGRLNNKRPNEYAANDGAESPLSGWHANLLLIQRRQYVLFVHDATRFPVFIPALKKDDFANLDYWFQDGFMNTLLKTSANDALIDRTHAVLGPLVCDTDCDRSVQGTMNRMAQEIEWALQDKGVQVAEITGYRVGAWLAERPCSTKGVKDCIWPKDAMHGLLKTQGEST